MPRRRTGRLSRSKTVRIDDAVVRVGDRSPVALDVELERLSQPLVLDGAVVAWGPVVVDAQERCDRARRECTVVGVPPWTAVSLAARCSRAPLPPSDLAAYHVGR